MKIRILLLLPLLALIECGPRVYRKLHLHARDAPADLRGKVWTMVKVTTNGPLAELDESFNTSINSTGCTIAFKFLDRGELIMTYQGREVIPGLYELEGNDFKRLYCGVPYEKVVWISSPECFVTPPKVGHVIGAYGGGPEYKVQGDTLTLKHLNGDVVILVSGR